MKKLVLGFVAALAIIAPAAVVAPAANAAPVVNSLELTYNDPTLSYEEAQVVKAWATGVCKAIQQGREKVSRVNRTSVATSLKNARHIVTTRDNIDLIVEGIRDCA